MTTGVVQTIQNESEIDHLNNNLKASSYNYFIRYDNDNFFGYNFLYKTILRIPTDAFPYVNHFLHGLAPKSQFVDDNSRPPRLPAQWQEALRQVNFVIDKNIDEHSLIRFSYFRNLYASESLSLIVLPTLWCNLACPYCFEFKKPVYMKGEVENALMDWLENNWANYQIMRP